MKRSPAMRPGTTAAGPMEQATVTLLPNWRAHIECLRTKTGRTSLLVITDGRYRVLLPAEDDLLPTQLRVAGLIDTCRGFASLAAKHASDAARRSGSQP